MNKLLFTGRCIAISYCVLLISFARLNGQDSLTMKLAGIAMKTDLTALTIGQQVPSMYPLKMVNYKKPDENFNEFKGKLVILDFWHQYCSSCVSQFPRLEALQNKFGDSILILPVTFQSQKSIYAFMRRRQEIGKTMNLPSIVEDTLLRKYFPHEGDPYEIWINKSGKVIGITSHYAVNDSNIQNVLKGNERVLIQQNLSMDLGNKILPQNNNNEDDFDSSNIYYSQLTRYNPHFRGRVPLEKDSRYLRCFYPNKTIIALFKMVCPDSSNDLFNIFRNQADPYNKRVIQKGYQSNQLQDWGSVTITDFNAQSNFLKTQLYCYNIVLPPSYSYRQANRLIHQNLESIFKVKVSIEKRQVRCLALTKTGKNLSLLKQEKILLNYTELDTGIVPLFDKPISELVHVLNVSLKIPYVIDQTFDKNPINMKLHLSPNDSPDTVRTQLRKYGFDLTPVVKTMEMLVIKDE